MRQWWPVAFIFVFLALLGVFVFLVAMPRGDSSGAPAAGAQGGTADATAPTEEELEEMAALFAEAIVQRQPVYTLTAWACPVDSVELQVPGQANRQSNNRFGGVATDLMSIALSPPTDGLGRPNLDSQDWEMLLVTCPQCGATFHGIDLWNLDQDLGYSLDGWDLAAVAPALAARDKSAWTVEERILVRLLTQRKMGVANVELGFTALQGAYAANFGTWYGKEVHIPSAGFYALASALFQRALDSDEELNAEARGITAMTQGEAYRLLGRADDALNSFALATELNALDDSRLEVIEQLRSLVKSGNSSLEIAIVGEVHVPPGGWYLSEMLPAINSHIAFYRADWAGMDEADAIIAALLEQLP